jgi:hypothetical protein
MNVISLLIAPLTKLAQDIMSFVHWLWNDATTAQVLLILAGIIAIDITLNVVIGGIKRALQSRLVMKAKERVAATLANGLQTTTKQQ